MANLSNINNILRTGSLGVGINRDPLGAFEISSATKPGIKMFNTAASGKTYEAYSDVNGNYIIYDQDADDNRFVINSAGNSTFAGNITGVGATFVGVAASGTALVTIENNSGSTATSYGLLVVGGGNSSNGRTFEVRDASGNTDLIVKGDGNVGIGTAGPSEKLTLQLDAQNQAFSGKNGTDYLWFLRNEAGAGARQSGRFQLMDTDVTTVNIESASNRNTYFNAGNVGIGTTSPSYKLEVNGGTTLVGGGFYVSTDQSVNTSFTYTFRDAVGINNPNSISATPNAGYTMCVGRSNNGAGVSGSLSAVGTIKATAFTVNIDTTAGIGGSNGDVNAAEIGPGYLNLSRDDTAAAQQIRFEKNGALHSYIETTTSGLNIGGANVGIGTTSPTNQLHVHTDTDDAYGIRIEGSTNNVAGVWTGLGIGGENANTKSALLFEDTVGSYARGKLHLCVNNGADQTSATPADAKLTIIPTGNVGIGTTSPNEKLQLAGNLNAYAPSGIDAGLFASTAAGSTTIVIRSSGITHFNGGNVGIGMTSPVAKLEVVEVSGTSAFNQSNNGAKIGRVQYGWYTGKAFNNNTAFTHIKTNLWMGGAPTGNTQYIMGGFTAKSYSYSASGYGEGSCMFHNWSGSFPNLSVTNRGSWATFMQSPYTSTDGYCVIVLRHNYYSTPTIDFCQYYSGYPWRQVSVTAQGQSSSATGLY